MKILQINTVCGQGSTGKIAAALLRMLQERGHEGRIAYGVGPAESAEAYRVVSRGQYYVHNLLSRLTGREGLFSVRQTRALVAEIRRYDPDVIHLHNLHGHYLHYEVLFRYLAEAGKPVVWTLHDCWPMTGHCTHFLAAGCSQWQDRCVSCSQLHQYPRCGTRGNVRDNYERKKAAFRGIPNLTLAAPSRWMAEQVQRSFLKDYPVQIIHNGIDLTVFRPAPGDFRKRYGCEDKFILLGVAWGWSHRKGLDVFIELSRRLEERYQIVLVGTDETVDRKLPEGILSIHRTRDQRELAQIYSATDLFVNPTREDTFPTVNMEALACGTPVLTFRTGGSPEIPDETCGAVVDCGDIDGLEREIRRVEAESPFSSAACVKRAAAFDARQQLAAYLRLYETAMGAEPACNYFEE